MNTITHNQRYLPHEFTTKYHSLLLYRSGASVSFVCRRYKISKSSLMRWNKKFDGTKESLMDKSHRSLTQHPNSHTEQELKWIRDYHRRNPNISVCKLYGKLRTEKGYYRHPGSLYRVFVRLGNRKKVPSTKNAYKPKHYNIPAMIGVKWQMDVKFVPRACSTKYEQYFQYTIIDKASRERFSSKEHNSSALSKISSNECNVESTKGFK